MRHFMAFDIGGTLIKYGVLTENGDFIERDELKTEAYLGGGEVLNKVKHIGDTIRDKYTISGVCISTAGQVDSKKGEIIYASSLIPDYTGMPVKQELETYFQLPVEVENDVNCVGLAESWVGKGKDAKSLFCLTVGTGVGGSYIIDNQLHTGHSFSGGEIGYIPIEGSAFEELASTRTLIRNVADEKGISEKDISGKDIFEQAQQGDKTCIHQIRRLVYYLSKGIATITYIMNPEMIVIGGGITQQKDYLYPLITEQLKRDMIPAILEKTKIEIAGNLNDAGMIGALRHFLLQESLQPFNKITTLIESNKHKLTRGEKIIANYITMNLRDVPNLTISLMAEKVDVSESMITRFCKKLDIGSFSKLRLMAKEAIVGAHIHDQTEENGIAEVKKDYISILQKFETLNQNNDMTDLKQKFMEATQLFVYGTGEMEFALNHIKYKLMRLGIPVDVFSSQYQMEHSLQLLKEDTIVVGISSSGYDKSLIQMLKQSRAKGAETIGLTSQQDSPLSDQSDRIVLIPSSDELGGTTTSINEIVVLYLLDIFSKELQQMPSSESVSVN